MTNEINRIFCELLNEAQKDLQIKAFSIHTPTDNGELSLPYILLSSTADEELIVRNHTWEFTLTVEVHTSADDQNEQDCSQSAGEVFSFLSDARDAINALSSDFILYSIHLSAIEEPEADERSFCQRATYRLVAQF